MAGWQDALARLERLLTLEGGFLGRQDIELAQEALEFATACFDLPQSPEQRGAVARSLARLISLLPQLWAALGPPAFWTASAVRWIQVTAACQALSGAATLAQRSGLADQRLLLQLAAAAAPITLHAPQLWLARWQAEAHDLSHGLCGLLESSSRAVQGMAALLAAQPSTALAAVARTAWEPDAFLPWLRAACAVLQSPACSGATALENADMSSAAIKAACHMAGTVHLLARHDAFVAHRQVIEEDAGLQDLLLQALLAGMDVILRQLRADSSRAAAGPAAFMAGQPHPAVDDSPTTLHAIHSMAAAMQAAASRPLGAAVQRLACQGGGLPRLLSIAADSLRLLAAVPGSGLSGDRAAWCAAALSLSGQAADSYAARHGSSSLLLDASGPAGSAPAGHTACGMDGSATVRAALGLLPLACMAVRRLCSCGGAAAAPHGGELEGGALSQAALLDSLCSIASLLCLQARSHAGVLPELQPTAAWCQAAEAALRLLPLLRQLGFQQGADTPPGVAAAAGRLAATCLDVFVAAIQSACASLQCCQLPGGHGTPAGDAVARSLWSLHTAACQLVHRELLSFAAQDLWCRVGAAISAVFIAAAIAGTAVSKRANGARDHDKAQEIARCLKAMCLAHAQVLPLLAHRSGQALDSTGPGNFMTELLCLCTHLPPSQLDAGLVAALTTSYRLALAVCSKLPREAQATGVAGAVWVAARDALQAAGARPRLAALLLHRGLLQETCDLLASEEQAGRLDHELSRHALLRVWSACSVLREEGLRAAGRMPAGAGAHTAPVSAAAEALGRILGSHPRPTGLLDSSKLWHEYRAELVPAAARLAAALQAYWAQPEQQQDELLEVAQAAAARSCAYLRCSQLQLEGGPGAGERPGSSKCSACRAVWYCSTACSHADWRGPFGHRRFCRALGAARQAARQQEQQAAAAGAAKAAAD